MSGFRPVVARGWNEGLAGLIARRRFVTMSARTKAGARCSATPWHLRQTSYSNRDSPTRAPASVMPAVDARLPGSTGADRRPVPVWCALWQSVHVTWRRIVAGSSRGLWTHSFRSMGWRLGREKSGSRSLDATAPLWQPRQMSRSRSWARSHCGRGAPCVRWQLAQPFSATVAGAPSGHGRGPRPRHSAPEVACGEPGQPGIR